MSLLGICLVLLVLFVALTAFLWVGTFFFQGYIYTQPSQQLYWQAPAAALLLTLGYGIWCFSIALGAKSSPQNIPINTLFRFNPYEDMFDNPAPKIWAIKVDRRKSAAENKEGEEVFYVSRRDNQTKFHYEEDNLSHRPWQRQNVVAVLLQMPDGTKLRFDPVQTGPGENAQFASKDGWVMQEFDTGPTGLPRKFSFFRLLVNLFFNFAHFLGWFLALWVVLRFQWGHAFGFALVLWVIMTLTVLPMLLTTSATVAVARQVPTS